MEKNTLENSLEYKGILPLTDRELRASWVGLGSREELEIGVDKGEAQSCMGVGFWTEGEF